MDFVTHAAVGALAGRAIGGPAPGPPTTALGAATLGALVALVPDLDHALEWVGAEQYLLYHRTATHSLLFLGVATLVAAALPAGALGRARRAVVVAASLASHLFLDVLTPFGTGLLWPFSARMETLDGLAIIAPWFAGAASLAAMLALPRRAPLGGRVAALLALAGLGVFIGAEMFVARRAAAAVPDPPAALAIPDWRDPVAATAFTIEDLAVVQYEVSPSGDAAEVARKPRNLRYVRAAPDRLVARFRLPVGSEEGALVVVDDAQFDAIGEAARPIRLVRDAAGWRVEQRALGLQPLLVLGVGLGVIALSRRRS